RTARGRRARAALRGAGDHVPQVSRLAGRFPRRQPAARADVRPAEDQEAAREREPPRVLLSLRDVVPRPRDNDPARRARRAEREARGRSDTGRTASSSNEAIRRWIARPAGRNHAVGALRQSAWEAAHALISSKSSMIREW